LCPPPHFQIRSNSFRRHWIQSNPWMDPIHVRLCAYVQRWTTRASTRTRCTLARARSAAAIRPFTSTYSSTGSERSVARSSASPFNLHSTKTTDSNQHRPLCAARNSTTTVNVTLQHPESRKPATHTNADPGPDPKKNWGPTNRDRIEVI